MKHQGIDSCGSFRAWGIGFTYRYDAASHTLDILLAGKNTPLTQFTFDEELSNEALAYTLIFEKSAQITALMMSNNMTVDLAATLDAPRLPSIVGETARMARHALDLGNERFDTFERFFCKDYAIRSLGIRKMQGSETGCFFYFATLESLGRNTVRAEGESLHETLSKLSSAVVHDLITTEVRYNHKTAPHAFLTLSYKLSVLSYILNDKFIPENQLREKRRDLDQISA